MAETKKTSKPEVEKGYTRLTAPTGAVTVVPDEIKQALLDSGYSEK